MEFPSDSRVLEYLVTKTLSPTRDVFRLALVRLKRVNIVFFAVTCQYFKAERSYTAVFINNIHEVSPIFQLYLSGLSIL